MVDNPSIRPYFRGGDIGGIGGALDSHETGNICKLLIGFSSLLGDDNDYDDDGCSFQMVMMGFQ